MLAEPGQDPTLLNWLLLPFALVAFFIILVVLFFIVGAIIHGPMGMLSRTIKVFAKEAAIVGGVTAAAMALSNAKSRTEETSKGTAEGGPANDSAPDAEADTGAWKPSEANPDDPYWKRLYDGNREFIDELKKIWNESKHPKT